ncbi:excinuclease ABC subunit UvrC [Pseudothermotoga elfii]
MDLLHKARLAPLLPGVYIFYGKNKEYIYVGKAKRLRNRLLSYFNRSNGKYSKKIQAIVNEAEELDYIVVSNEREALLLEANLIFNHKPKYNVMLKDAEFYPYIKITKELFPAVQIVRRRSTGGEYFGPYTDVKFVKDLIDCLQQVYQFRTCRRDMSKSTKPCMEFYMHRCAAPCTGDLEPDSYINSSIQPLRRVLNGDISETLDLIKEKMKKHAKMMDFENAAKYRDLLVKFENVMQRQGVVLEQWRNLDVIGRFKNSYAVLRIRGGHVVGKLSYELDSTKLEDFIFHYYMVGKNELPEAVILERNINFDAEIYFGRPRDKLEEELLHKARENAKNQAYTSGLRKDLLNKMVKVLNLNRYPMKIEGFDVSHLHGKLTVASVVVFFDGLPRKNEYRHYRFNSDRIDDFLTLKELVKRRYSKHELPDMIFVDGGTGQINAVVEALMEIGKECDVVGLAKQNEIVCTRFGELILPFDSPILRTLVRIRDEAHRFANSFHRKLRRKSALNSILDEIPGIGPKRKKKLIEAFGSVKNIRSATLQEIAEVLGSRKLAAEILSRL